MRSRKKADGWPTIETFDVPSAICDERRPLGTAIDSCLMSDENSDRRPSRRYQQTKAQSVINLRALAHSVIG